MIRVDRSRRQVATTAARPPSALTVTAAATVATAGCVGVFGASTAVMERRRLADHGKTQIAFRHCDSAPLQLGLRVRGPCHLAAAIGVAARKIPSGGDIQIERGHLSTSHADNTLQWGDSAGGVAIIVRRGGPTSHRHARRGTLAGVAASSAAALAQRVVGSGNRRETLVVPARLWLPVGAAAARGVIGKYVRSAGQSPPGRSSSSGSPHQPRIHRLE